MCSQVSTVNGGNVLNPSVEDCQVADPMWANYTPTGPAETLISNCISTNATKGFGCDSVCGGSPVALTPHLVLLQGTQDA